MERALGTYIRWNAEAKNRGFDRNGVDVLKDHRDYYDEFSEWYEDERHAGYRSVIEDLESDLVRRYAFDRDVLEVGCETGRTLERIAPLARRLVGVEVEDVGRRRESSEAIEIVEAEADALPFEDEQFDVVYSFKTLPHVPNVESSIREMARVTRPGGRLLLEFYNPMSLRYLAQKFDGEGEVARAFRRDETDYIRWDHPLELSRWYPEDTVVEQVEGLHVVTPAAIVHRLPYVRYFVRKLEFVARDTPILKYLAGFLVSILRKT
jgi:SAM-dependent methyltransferase